MTRNLIPTPVTDKNGKQTTVHKKPAIQTTSNTSIPHPTLNDVKHSDRQHLEHETAEALVNQNFQGVTTEESRRKKSYQQILAALPQYSDDILNRIIQATSTRSGYNINDMLCSSYADREYISDWTIIDSSTRDKDIDVDTLTISLEKYNNLPPQEENHYPSQRKEIITAITRVTNHLETNGQGITTEYSSKGEHVKFIEDDALRDLITTHENPSAIADIIISRNLSDPDQITTLLATMDNTATAINDGAL